MNAYIKSLKEEGYISLRDEYYDTFKSFPALGKKDTTKPLDPDTIDLEDQSISEDDDDESGRTREPVESSETTQVEELSQTETSKDTAQVPLDQTPLSPTEQTTEENQVKGLQQGNDQSKELPTDTNEKAPTLQVKQGEESLSQANTESTDEAVKTIQGKLRSCSVSLLRPPSIRLPTTPTSPNQVLFPPPAPPIGTIPNLQSLPGTRSVRVPYDKIYHRKLSLQ